MSGVQRIVLDREGFALDVEFGLEPGEVVALMGPNGAGKTSLLRAMAGLEPGVPAYAADTGIVFQDDRLFPHLSALDNVAFAHEAVGRRRAEARRLALSDLDQVGCRDLAARRPGELSGGERQRVAIARVLVGRPQILLLDEPFASLDAAVRQLFRRDLAPVLRADRRSSVLVTHDPVDAMVLADRVVVVEAGRVTHDAPAAGIALRPRSAWAAELLGLNLLFGTSDGTSVHLRSGATVNCAEPPDAGIECAVRFDPASVELHVTHPHGGSARNVWAGSIVAAERVGARVRVQVAGEVDLVAEVTSASVERLSLDLGTPVFSSLKATEVEAYPIP